MDHENIAEEETVMSQQILFQGTLKKIRIVSNALSYGLEPGHDEEVEQHLSISDIGQVWFSGYAWGIAGQYEKRREKVFTISKVDTNRLFAAITAYFSDEKYTEVFATDIGVWILELTNAEGSTYRFHGSLCAGFEYEGTDLSDMVRDVFGMDDLYVFDGNSKPDIIERITLDYRSTVKMASDQQAVKEPVIRSHKERLVIDRETGTLEYRKEYGGENRVSGKYEMKDKIENLLDEFDAEELFSYVEENPDDVIDTPDENLSYKITVDYKKNPQRVIEGDFDKKSLPEDFADFIERVSRFIRCYGIGDIFNPLIYRKKKRCKTDHIFCSVIFESPYKSYYYLTDDDSIDIGDFVVVPAGKDDHEAVVEVIDVEYFNEADAPFPVDKTKKIIRKCTDEEVELLEDY